MQPRHISLLSLGLLTCLLFPAKPLQACSCAGAYGASNMREVAKHYSDGPNASMIVFEGSVERQELQDGNPSTPLNEMSMILRGQHRAVWMRVLRTYRGQAEGVVKVLTSFDEASCGFDFETGREYLVYADRIESEALFTHLCTGTKSLERSGPALRYLRGESPTPDDLLDLRTYYEKFATEWTGRACGKVTHTDEPTG